VRSRKIINPAVRLASARFLITSTQLYDGVAPSPEWRYLAPETGQHVAFYRRETLERLAREAGFDIWLDPTIQLGHVGTKIYRGNPIEALELEDLMKQEKVQ